MSKHLFIEGPIGTGKSTLLRKQLHPFIKETGGFASQRLVDESGKTVAFRIASPEDELTASMGDSSADNIFLVKKESIPVSYEHVWNETGSKLLNEAGNRKIILLDEIGGVELLNDSFKNALYRILSGDTPCIGVIKLAENTRRMDRAGGYEGRVLKENEALRHELSETWDGRIIYYERDDAFAAKEVEKFLCGIFTTIQ